MERKRQPAGQEPTQQTMAADQPGTSMGNPDPRRTPLSPQLRVPPSPPQPYPQPTGDDRNVNHPWDTESGRIPSVKQSTADGADVGSDIWRWDTTLEQSYAGVSIDNMTGTGKMPAMVPLSPHDSWSKGLRAPTGAGTWPPEVEVDEQPSAQMRALRVGNLARAATIVSTALLLSRVLGLVRTTLFAATFGGHLYLNDAD